MTSHTMTEETKTNHMRFGILGDTLVGKTSLVDVYTTGQFYHTHKLSKIDMGPSKDIHIEDKKYSLVIWDTNGSENYAFMRGEFFNNKIDGAMIVFDLSRKTTYDKVPYFLREVWDYSYGIPIMLVGNKKDLCPEFSSHEAQAFANNYGQMDYIKTSAKDFENVNKAFEMLGKMVVAKRNREF
jgi:small GTP-binding protein